MTPSLPATYTEWRHCITEVCGIPLTADFIQHRLSVLGNPHNDMTKRFIALYGKPHWQQTKQWFMDALNELDR